MNTVILFVPLFSSLVIIYIIGYVVGQRKKQDVNRAFLLFLLDFFLLTFLEFIVRFNCSRGVFNYTLVRIVGVCAACNGFLLLNFIVAMAGKKREIPYYVSAVLAASGCVFVCMPGVRIGVLSSGDIPILTTNAFSLLTILFILPSEIYAGFVAFSAYRRSADEATRTNYVFLFAGTLSSSSFYILGKILYPLTSKWYVGDQCSSVAFVIFALVLFRAISKHKFLSYDREKELVRARQLESLGLLAAGIAHDFNNLLTGILASFSLIKNTAADHNPQIGEIAGVGLKASEQAAKLSRQLLTFAKGGEPILETVNVKLLVSEAVAFVLHGSSCKVSIDMPDESSGILADRGQLVQVFHNLAINSRQAMPSGGAIRVTGKKIAISGSDCLPVSAGEYMEISFADTGTGIDREHLDRIFDPYFTTKSGGNGLGLAIAYSIIRRHKGHITVASKKGSGTTFTIVLPMAKDAIKPVPTPSKTGGPGSTGSILVVDDEDVVRSSLERILAFFGFFTESARNAEEALSLFAASSLKGNCYACCIIDLTMPGGMNGKDLGTMLLSKNPSLKIVISSGYHDDPVMARFRDYGFAGVLEKPFAVEDIRLSVDVSGPEGTEKTKEKQREEDKNENENFFI